MHVIVFEIYRNVCIKTSRMICHLGIWLHSICEVILILYACVWVCGYECDTRKICASKMFECKSNCWSSCLQSKRHSFDRCNQNEELEKKNLGRCGISETKSKHFPGTVWGEMATSFPSGQFCKDHKHPRTHIPTHTLSNTLTHSYIEPISPVPSVHFSN